MPFPKTIVENIAFVIILFLVFLKVNKIFSVSTDIVLIVSLAFALASMIFWFFVFDRFFFVTRVVFFIYNNLYLFIVVFFLSFKYFFPWLFSGDELLESRVLFYDDLIKLMIIISLLGMLVFSLSYILFRISKKVSSVN